MHGWNEIHAAPASEEDVQQLGRCSYTGRPCGDNEFVARMEQTFGRVWGSGKAINAAKERVGTEKLRPGGEK